MRALLRILVVIPLGYVAACAAAGIVFALSLYGFTGESDPAIQGIAISFAVAMAVYAGALAAVPTLAAIVLAEAFAWRSFFFWSLFGGVLGLAGKVMQDNAEGVHTPSRSTRPPGWWAARSIGSPPGVSPACSHQNQELPASAGSGGCR